MRYRLSDGSATHPRGFGRKKSAVAPTTMHARASVGRIVRHAGGIARAGRKKAIASMVVGVRFW
jgi:hypothetical protein